MSHDVHHDHLIKELAEELKPIFSKSPQAIYLYLDDTHKICNQKFADMLGYKSIDEWVAYETPVEDVDEADRDKVIDAYGRASETMQASKIFVTINKKDGEKVDVSMIMTPLTYKGEIFVLHFISKEK